MSVPLPLRTKPAVAGTTSGPAGVQDTPSGEAAHCAAVPHENEPTRFGDDRVAQRSGDEAAAQRVDPEGRGCRVTGRQPTAGGLLELALDAAGAETALTPG